MATSDLLPVVNAIDLQVMEGLHGAAREAAGREDVGAVVLWGGDRVFAAGEGGNTLVIIGGVRDGGGRYVYYELMSGTWGARPDRDGNDGLCNPANVASNIPVDHKQAKAELKNGLMKIYLPKSQPEATQIPIL